MGAGQKDSAELFEHSSYFMINKNIYWGGRTTNGSWTFERSPNGTQQSVDSISIATCCGILFQSSSWLTQETTTSPHWHKFLVTPAGRTCHRLAVSICRRQGPLRRYVDGTTDGRRSGFPAAGGERHGHSLCRRCGFRGWRLELIGFRHCSSTATPAATTNSGSVSAKPVAQWPDSTLT